MKRYALMLSMLLVAGNLCGAALKVGFGRQKITPPMPIWLAGFSARTHAAEGIAHDLWTKALAIEDGRGQKLIVITIDLVIMPKAMTDMVAARVTHRHGIARPNLLINFSHTHSGPSLSWSQKTDREMMLRVEGYRKQSHGFHDGGGGGGRCGPPALADFLRHR